MSTLQHLQNRWQELEDLYASTKEVVTYLRFNLRSQIYAKSLPMAMTIGAIKRLEFIKAHPEYKEKLWTSR